MYRYPVQYWACTVSCVRTCALATLVTTASTKTRMRTRRQHVGVYVYLRYVCITRAEVLTAFNGFLISGTDAVMTSSRRRSL